jgi:outer membrane protein assembly factor BamD (BamD/ComL family)
MTKNKPTRKELLKSPDEFLTLSSRAVLFFKAHVRELKIAGVTVAGLAVIYTATYAYFRYVNRGGQEAYNTAYYSLKRAGRGALEPDNLVKAEGLFKRVVEDYGLSKAARLALPQLGYAKFVKRQYDEAIALYKEFGKAMTGDASFEFLTNLAVSNCYEAKGDLNSAVQILKPLREQTGNPFREEALRALARLYRIDNRPEEEKRVLQEFLESYPDSPFAAAARARL